MSPWISPLAQVGPDCTILGPVTIGPGCRIQPGARIVAEGGGRIRLGTACIVLENAVIRATARQDCTIGDHCLIGPHAHVVGAGAVVPIGWVAVGTPAQILPPDQHVAIWEVQRHLDFPGFVYGFDRTEPGLMRKICARLSEELGQR